MRRFTIGALVGAVMGWWFTKDDGVIDTLIARNAATRRKGMEHADWKQIEAAGSRRWFQVRVAQQAVARRTGLTAVGAAGRLRRGMGERADVRQPDSVN